MISLKHCPLCRRPPTLEAGYVGYRLRCPGCGDCAVRWSASYDGAVEDLRAVALVETGTMATGRVHDWESKEWRHTKFYSLNVEWIDALAKAVL